MLGRESENLSPPNSVDCTDYSLMIVSSPSENFLYSTFSPKSGKKSSRTLRYGIQSKYLLHVMLFISVLAVLHGSKT